MFSRNRIVTLFAFAVSTAPLSLSSQSTPALQADPVELWIIEMQYIQAQLAPIEERALQEAALAQEQESLGNAVLAAMIEEDPTVQPKLERLRQIMIEAHASLGDAQQLEALAAEAGALQPHIERVRGAALARPDIDARMATFRRSLYARMTEIAPESREMVARFEELERLIRSSLQQGSTAPTGKPR